MESRTLPGTLPDGTSPRLLLPGANRWVDSLCVSAVLFRCGILKLTIVQPEPGYKIFDFKGAELVTNQLDRFKQFLWRSRPPTLLTKDAQRKVRKELKEHSRQFDEEDAAEENRGSAEKLAQRQRDIAEWNAWRARNVARLLEERRARGKEVFKAVEHVEEEEKVEEWIEELIDETEEVVV